MKYFIPRRFATSALTALVGLLFGVCALPCQAQVQLTWNDNSSTETNFAVERSATAFGPWTGIATLAANSTSYTDNLAAGGTTYYYRVQASNANWASRYSNIASKTTPIPISGTGLGLSGQYYADRTLSSLVMTRTDPTIDFDWGAGSPNPSLPIDSFSIRWSGQIQTQEGGTYTFQTQIDDRVRLWIGGVLLIDNWDSPTNTVTNSTVQTLAANTKYSIKLEYKEMGGSASARFKWIRPGQSVAVIVPQSQLY